MEETVLSFPWSDRKSRASSSRLRRAGDDWEGLDHEVAAAFPSRPAESSPPASFTELVQGRLSLASCSLISSVSILEKLMGGQFFSPVYP